MKPDLPPLRGLDQNAGDVEGGVIGSPKRIGGVLVIAAMMLMVMGLIAWWV